MPRLEIPVQISQNNLTEADLDAVLYGGTIGSSKVWPHFFRDILRAKRELEERGNDPAAFVPIYPGITAKDLQEFVKIIFPIPPETHESTHPNTQEPGR